MRTRLLAGCSLVAVAATACSTSAAEPRQPHANPPALGIAELHMVSASDGWASTTSGALTRTTDGGRTWRAVGNCPVDQVLPVGTDELWTASTPTSDATVCHTTDGGRTWQTSTFHIDDDASVTAITSPDPHDVWIETQVPQGMHSNSLISLYRSTDTGRTWQEVATAGDDLGDDKPGPSGLAPSCDRDVGFASATTGWSVGGCPQGNGAMPDEPVPQHFQTSTDGGQHWSAQAFPPATQAAYNSLCRQQGDCVFGDPTFAGAEGIVVCQTDNANQTLIALFTTEDAGHTWTVRDAAPAGPYDQPVVEVVNPQVVLVSVTGGKAPALTETADAGRSWHSVPLPPTNGSYYWEPQFVDARDGFVSQNTELESTTDGGRHWTAISPTMVK